MTAVYLSWVFDDVRICEIERSYKIGICEIERSYEPEIVASYVEFVDDWAGRAATGRGGSVARPSQSSTRRQDQ